MEDTQAIKHTPLPVAKVFREALKFPFHQARQFWIWVLALCLILFAISQAEHYIWLMLRDLPLPIKGWLGVSIVLGGLGNGLAFTLLAITCHRLILLEEQHERWVDSFSWNRRETRFFMWSFFIYLGVMFGLLHSIFIGPQTTFDLASLSGMATSATLKVVRAFDAGGNEALETLEFFDVSTNAATLNNNAGTSQAIFDDLGTGNSYGSFAVAGSGVTTEVLLFVLNAQALTDINAAGGFFSIGGSLTSDNGNDGFFLSSQNAGPVQLDITTGPVNPPAIPEPSTMLLFGSGLAALAAWRHKARRTM